MTVSEVDKSVLLGKIMAVWMANPEKRFCELISNAVADLPGDDQGERDINELSDLELEMAFDRLFQIEIDKAKGEPQ